LDLHSQLRDWRRARVHPSTLHTPRFLLR